MKKGDRIRCKRACGSLNKGDEGICEEAPGLAGGLGLFAKGAYGLGCGDWDIYFEVIPDNSLADFSALDVQQGGTQKLERFLVFAWDKGRAKGGANDLVLDTPKYNLAMNHISTHHDCVQIVDSELGITLYQKVVL